ncbi:perlucin-like protein isoform X2 [Mizuhopecten yessoensis]|uniref:perlucin-like protein isoform X2 n=1 Tax=Mizuhopecten yessoensis TaxID=6573 RepID=UPI000B45D85E|nr:perlucin-like protein isoform X2 [Mizuhopecten yessoensis]
MMKILFRTVFLCFCVIIEPNAVQALGCRNGWIQFESSCYFFSNDVETWAEASIICADLKGHLATVNSAAENSFLKAQANVLKQTGYWLDGNDFEVEGSWRWTTSDDLITFNDWHSGEPNQGASADCLALWRDHAYQWADEPCRHVWNFICKTNIGDGEQAIG